MCLCGSALAGSAPELALQRGKVLLANGDPDAAVAALDVLVERFPGSASAAEGAMLVLDALDRAQRFDELTEHVERFLRDRRLRRHHALARELRRVYLRCCVRRDVAPHTDYEREALDRLDDFAADPMAPDGDELLYEAGWQFYVSNHPDEAARAWRVLLALFPHSNLVGRAKLGLEDVP